MGPLQGLRIIEIAAIGPVPMAAMLLADQGAEVIRVDRPPAAQAQELFDRDKRFDVLSRGRKSVVLDLKKKEDVAALLALLRDADALLEGMRPGVAERLGIGPEACLAANPRLVYGRMTGWGQDGTLAHAAGHDINYIAVAGVLHAVGRAGGPPTPPLNLVGDFGGGALFLAFGVMAALWERERSGKGQVVDAAMVDGAAFLLAPIFGLHGAGIWSNARGENLLDSGCPFYDSYATKDGRYLAVGALEAKFFAELVQRIGLEARFVERQNDRTIWPEMRKRFEQIFASKTRDEWIKLLEGTDACVTAVPDLDEAPRHAHNASRGVFIEVDGVPQPAPAPRFSRTPAGKPTPPPEIGAHDAEILKR
jgi:alpha-methylacyl-CoA racemase